MSTIAAIATPPGQGGIAIIRLSGPSAKEILARVFLPHSPLFTNFKPWKLHHGAVLDSKENVLDDALAVFMPGPNSYTGEDITEIHCHGNPVITHALLEHLFLLGAEPAKPGEFTKRAYLNGRMDLSQAEAVAEMVSAPSREAVRLSFDRLEGRLSRDILQLVNKIEQARQHLTVLLDFPDDEIDLDLGKVRNLLTEITADFDKLLDFSKCSRLYQNGARVVLAGNTNAGKSSLLNALSGKNRALVTPFAGTTRDFLEQDIIVDGLAVTLIDTAGFRESENADPIEKMGIRKSQDQLKDADLILLVLDGESWANNPDWQPDEPAMEILKNSQNIPVILIWNKCDLTPTKKYKELSKSSHLQALTQCATSCVTGENLDLLKKTIFNSLVGQKSFSQAEHVLPNARQAILLEKAKKELELLLSALDDNLPLDCCAAHLDEISRLLGDVLGLSANEEILDKIFSNFCIGK